MPRKSDVSDKEFLDFLTKNAGLFARTAKAIEIELGITLTRQAIKMRADKLSREVLKDIQERNIDIAESALHDLIESKNENIKLRAAELYLRTIGRHRGYIEKAELSVQGVPEKEIVVISAQEYLAQKKKDKDAANQ